MDPRAYLTELGYSNEDITAMLADDKQSKLITAAAKSYGEGRTLKQQAEAQSKETTDFWEAKTQELQGSVTRLTAAEKKAAEADAERARYAAYLKSLKDQGYDVPDSLVTAPVAAKTEPQYITREDALKMARGTAPDLVTLTALSNEYQYLYGKPYLSINEDFAEAQRAGKPLNEYARSKHGFDAKRAELQKAEDQKRIDGIVAEEKKKWEAEHAMKSGSNPNTSSPVPSKFDRLSKQSGFKSDSWKSEEGRSANRQDRLKRFENISIQ